MRLTVFVSIIGLVVNCWPAVAQETIDLHKHGMHVKGYQQDPYSGIFNWAGVNCCNGQDCRKIVDPKDVQPITGVIESGRPARPSMSRQPASARTVVGTFAAPPITRRRFAACWCRPAVRDLRDRLIVAHVSSRTRRDSCM